MGLFSKILKVCRVDDLAFGKFAILNGIDYLGVHIIEEKNIGDYLDLVKKLSLLGGRVVIVSKIDDAELLKKVIELYHPYGLQLHFCPNIDLIKNIKNTFPHLKIFSVITDDLTLEVIELVSYLSDFVIYDSSFVGGTGERNKLGLLEKISSNVKNKLLVAGGVDYDFIEKCKDIDVAGFDAQSFFRNGELKYFNRLEKISRLIKGVKHNMLAVSVTDRNDIKSCSTEYIENPLYDYHVDYSDGSLYKDFVVNKQETLNKVAQMVGVPISIHIFCNKEKDINLLMKEFSQINANSVSSFFVQYYPGLNLRMINKDQNLVVSVYYKDLKNYLAVWYDFSQYVSIILPSNDIQKIQHILNFIDNNSSLLSQKEIWFDREMNKEKISLLKNILNMSFNAVVGKAITKNINTIKEIYEQLCIQK